MYVIYARRCVMCFAEGHGDGHDGPGGGYLHPSLGGHKPEVNSAPAPEVTPVASCINITHTKNIKVPIQVILRKGDANFSREFLLHTPLILFGTHSNIGAFFFSAPPIGQQKEVYITETYATS